MGCPPVTGLTVSGVTACGAQVTWSPGGGESAWSIFYATTLVVPDRATVPTMDSIQSPLAWLGDLVPNTTYYVYVRALCSDTAVSVWSPVSTFTTNNREYADKHDTICGGMSYPWRDSVYLQSGIYCDTVYNAQSGTDSIYRLHLQVDTIWGDTSAFHCSHFTWYGNNYTASDIYTHVRPLANGCDSVVRLHLTIGRKFKDTSVIACDSYTWYGTTLTPSGDYGHTIVGGASNGCDSVIRLHLTVRRTSRGDTTATACDRFVWYGMVYRSSTTPIHHFTNAVGCDSTVTLRLTIYRSSTGEDTVTTCHPYTWTAGTGYTYTESSDTSTYTLPNRYGCDSTVTLHLTISGTLGTVYTDTACESYTWHVYGDSVYTQSGLYVCHYYNDEGCEVNDTLHLAVFHTAGNSYSTVVCDSMRWHDVLYTVDTVVQYHYLAGGRCTSTDTLHLEIHHSSSAGYAATGCDSYVWSLHDTSYAEGGIHLYPYSSVGGCASTDTLHLTLYHSGDTVYTASACDTYTWAVNAGTTYTQSGSYARHYTTPEGCASVDTLHLTIHHGSHTLYDIATCDNYYWAVTDSIYLVSTADTVSYTDGNGCASVDTLHLVLHYGTSVAVVDTACNYYDWHGTRYTSGGVYYYSYISADNCASVDTLRLVLHYGSDTVYVVSACEEYVWEANQSHRYASSGVYLRQYTSGDGCASTDTLRLTVNHGTHDTTVRQVCNSYRWHDSTYTASGTYRYDYLNAVMCPSTDTLHLTLQYGTDTVYDELACDMFWWHDSLYTVGGVYVRQTLLPNGCLDIDTLRLTINYSNRVDTSVTACDAFVWNGQTYLFDEDIVDAYMNQYGCDSVYKIHLTMHYSAKVDTLVEACDQYVWRGRTHTSDAIDTAQLITSEGCDSVVTLHLVMHNSVYYVQEAVACDSFRWFDSTYTQSTDEPYQILQAANGCDSMVTLSVYIVYSTTGEHVISACGNYIWEGDTFTVDNHSVVHTYTNIYDCDSVVTLNLTVHYDSTYYDTLVVCDSLAWGGITYTVSGVYTQTYESMYRCDSTVVIDLTVLPTVYTDEQLLLCESDLPYVYNDTVFDRFAQSGMLQFVRTAASGCDSVVRLNLDVYHGPLTTPPTVEFLCDRMQYRLIVLHSDDVSSVTWSSVPGDTAVASQTHADTIYVAPSEPTTYTVSAVAPLEGCSNSKSVMVDPVPQFRAAIYLVPPYITVDRREFIVEERNEGDILWYNWYVDGADYGSEHRFTYTVPLGVDDVELMLVAAESRYGCVDTAVTVVRRQGGILYAPTAFKPADMSSDNKRFHVRLENVVEYEITIYSRTGVQVFHSTDIFDSWDGNLQRTGEKCPMGVYTYIIRYSTDDAPRSPQTAKGSVLLIR